MTYQRISKFKTSVCKSVITYIYIYSLIIIFWKIILNFHFFIYKPIERNGYEDLQSSLLYLFVCAFSALTVHKT